MMMKLCLLFFLFFLISCQGHVQIEKSSAEYVNPFIDTHKSRWFFFSSASRPFGMVNLSPDTNVDGSWKSGYMFDSTYVRCFSHVHAWQLSGIPVMPTVGDFKGHLGMEAYKSSFSHKGEIAVPGYHKLYLEDYDVWAELTSTCRVGMHRYTFPESDQAYVLFDTGAFLAHADMDSSFVKKINDCEIEGMSLMAPTGRRPKATPIYFVARFNKRMSAFGGWRDSTVLDELTEISGKDIGVFARFETREREKIILKVAISYNSPEQARKNMDAELCDWDFDRVKKESFDEWDRELGKIRVEGGSEKQKIKFYTDLWHALLGRRIVSDVDGKYLDMTGDTPVTRQAPLDKRGNPWPHYNFDALWGSHWSLNILWSMVYPEVMDGFCNTMVSMYENGGLIPRGPSGGNYTYVMIGDPAASFFATAYNKGIRNYNVVKAYEGLRKNAFVGGIRDHAGYEHESPAFGGGMDFYVRQGWIPERIRGKGGHKDGCAMTLEYAYQDWCLAQLAANFGKWSDYELFMRRSQNYRNVWNPENKYMQPREIDGSWCKEFKPIGSEFGFTEANGAVYTHFVPHDMQGLIGLFGGKDAYVERLNRQFVEGEKNGFKHDRYYTTWTAYTNQPGTGMAHLFNHAGYPWLTQKWVRKVKDAYGDITPYGGYEDDEDQGQMGALGVLMAIGLFEVDGGAAEKPVYEITSPIFDRIVIKLNPDYYRGNQFEIITNNNSSENIYIQSAKLNGNVHNTYWFFHDDFTKGGILILNMDSIPNKEWGYLSHR